MDTDAELMTIQLRHLHEGLGDLIEGRPAMFGFGDDGGDYLNAALTLATEMHDAILNDNLIAFLTGLNAISPYAKADDPYPLIDAYACDGVSPRLRRILELVAEGLTFEHALIGTKGL